MQRTPSPRLVWQRNSLGLVNYGSGLAHCCSKGEATGYMYEAQAIFNNDRPMLTIVGDFLIEAFRTDRFDFPIPGESCDMTPAHWNGH